MHVLAEGCALVLLWFCFLGGRDRPYLRSAGVSAHQRLPGAVVQLAQERIADEDHVPPLQLRAKTGIVIVSSTIIISS